MVMYYGKYKVFKWCWDANLHSDGLKNNIQCTLNLESTSKAASEELPDLPVSVST